ncbi:hypothetical protein [Streptomyces sp. NBC_00343]|uniref:hypothetical protein n=1 Tax=Streptomyces sp. NBC_00343 TaxID=2975719 RepID=UPI002E27B599|nr:hypothetical protein [Streptomyces sp. NBC_00343]
MCAESASWATKARLQQTRVIAAANQSAGRTVVRTLRILAPGAVPAADPADVVVVVPAAAALTGEAKTRETVREGHHRISPPRIRAASTRTSRKLWSGRRKRCASSANAPSSSRSWNRSRSGLPVISAVVTPKRSDSIVGKALSRAQTIKSDVFSGHQG